MGDGRETLILSRSWRAPATELSFVTRAVAGAASRCGGVTVLIPSMAGSLEPDGAFDLLGLGAGADGGWPAPEDATRPASVPAEATVIVDAVEAATASLVGLLAPDGPCFTVAPAGNVDGVIPLRFSGTTGDDRAEVIGVHVPVNPLAAHHRHNGLGFTGYLLILSDRAGHPPMQPTTEMAAWLTARFPRADVVVVEGGSAAVWRGRAVRGVVSVDTRTDFWRLLSHARLTIDLSPGEIIARECIESLRFGTPIVVPSTSAARPHAEAGGGLSYAGFAELLDCVTELSDDSVHTRCAAAGRAYADSQYGDPAAFVTQVAARLGV